VKRKDRYIALFQRSFECGQKFFLFLGMPRLYVSTAGIRTQNSSVAANRNLCLPHIHVLLAHFNVQPIGRKTTSAAKSVDN